MLTCRRVYGVGVAANEAPLLAINVALSYGSRPIPRLWRRERLDGYPIGDALLHTRWAKHVAPGLGRLTWRVAMVVPMQIVKALPVGMPYVH